MLASVGALASLVWAIFGIAVAAAALVGGFATVRGYQQKNYKEAVAGYKEASAGWKTRCEEQDRQIAELKIQVATLTTANDGLQTQLDALRTLVQGVEQIKALRAELTEHVQALLAAHAETLTILKAGAR